jgi:hypothetical protein
MSAFEFTNAGVRPLEDSPAPGGIINARAAIAAIEAQGREATVAPPVVAQSKPEASPTKPITRKSFVPELKARLRVVEGEIRRLRALEDEAAELKRLIQAAKAPPAKVTDISTARKSG